MLSILIRPAIMGYASILWLVGRVTITGGPGTSLADAFVINASNTFAGVGAEHVYLKLRFPRWQPIAQALREEGDRYYDFILLSRDGEDKEVWFDVTSFFGK